MIHNLLKFVKTRLFMYVLNDQQLVAFLIASMCCASFSMSVASAILGCPISYITLLFILYATLPSRIPGLPIDVKVTGWVKTCNVLLGSGSASRFFESVLQCNQITVPRARSGVMHAVWKRASQWHRLPNPGSQPGTVQVGGTSL